MIFCCPGKHCRAFHRDVAGEVTGRCFFSLTIRGELIRGSWSLVIVPVPVPKYKSVSEEEVKSTYESHQNQWSCQGYLMHEGRQVSSKILQTSSWSFIHTHHQAGEVFFFAFPYRPSPRCTALYMAMLSCQTLDWCLENLGLGQMDVFTNIMLRMWSTHPNPVIKHHVGAQVVIWCTHPEV